MPDYNRKAGGYWWCVVALGAAALLHSAWEVAALPAQAMLQVAVGLAIAMTAGLFPVRIGRSRSSFAAGEVFIFLLLLLHGPAAATLAAACETLVGALRSSKRWTSRIASPAISAVAMLGTGWLLQAALHGLALIGADNDGTRIIATAVCALAYFALNTLLVSAIPRLKRDELPQPSDLLGMFGWVGIAFAGSGAIAALLHLSFRHSGMSVLVAILPLMAMLLATLHYWSRQQEAHEAMRVAAAKAAEREAEVAAQTAAREAEIAARHLRQLEASERRFHSAFTHASIGMALLATDGRILQANAALRSLLGLAESTQRLPRLHDLVAPDDQRLLDEQLAAVRQQSVDVAAFELRCRHSDGTQVWVAAHCSDFSEPGATTPCLILQIQDITARRKAEASLHRLAFHDALTGLPNRRLFAELLSETVEKGKNDPSAGYALMFLDFDRFKLINDSLGHGAGDEFLVQVSRRIQDQVRPHDVVARLGGDEFAILMRKVTDPMGPVILVERLMRALQQPFLIAGTELTTSASVGITTSAQHYEKAEDALRDADTAMYKAKAAGKARYALFDSSLHQEVAQRMRLESDLKRAIETEQLCVFYQPLYELVSGRLLGFEALARWQHPELGPIGPGVFIPIAEESGLIVALTELVLNHACQQLRQWQLIDPEFEALGVHVNISGKDIAHSPLVARVTHALVQARLQPECLTIELTENILMERLEMAMPMLENLRLLGVRLSVDDFGTGYSSLAHLAKLPIDSIKVDRSFICQLSTRSKEAAVVRAIVNLSQALDTSVIAEGIETASQFELLREMGCRAGQGFHMSKPLSAQDASTMLRNLAGKRSAEVLAQPRRQLALVSR